MPRGRTDSFPASPPPLGGEAGASGALRPSTTAWSTRTRDALVWTLLSAAVLIALRDTYISADGMGNAVSATLDRGLNPNHLLFEPLDAAWLRATGAWFPLVEGVDRLRWLSALYGALALGLFRFGLAPRLAAGRTAAQVATAAMAASAGFLQMWLSAECHILQMPFAVAVAIAICRFREAPSTARAVEVGAAIAAAALSFISLAGLAFSAAALIASRSELTRRRRVLWAALVPAVAGALTVGALLLAWACTARSHPFVAWATAYGGGAQARTQLVYGIQPGNVGIAGARAAYGAVSTWVDLAPAVAGWRDHGERGLPALAGVVAGLALLLLLAGPRASGAADRTTRALAALLLPPLLLFGWFWNNSDAQFYLPIAIVLGAAAARAVAGPPWARAILAVVLLWNTGAAIERYVLYPRAALSALLLRETAGACAVVTPGFDDAGVLLALSGRETLAVTGSAVASAADEGLPRLLGRLEQCLQAGGRVELVNIYDRPPREAPWKFLAALGYPPEKVRSALAVLPLAPSRSVGPFTLRTAQVASPAPPER